MATCSSSLENGLGLTTLVEHKVFGGGSGSKALVAYCDYFKEKYAVLSETQRNWALTVASKGWFRTPYGMKFYFPGTKMQASGYITNSTKIYNYPIQGFATGEIIPIALVCFWHRTRDLRVTIFNSVHSLSSIYHIKKSHRFYRYLMKVQ